MHDMGIGRQCLRIDILFLGFVQGAVPADVHAHLQFRHRMVKQLHIGEGLQITLPVAVPKPHHTQFRGSVEQGIRHIAAVFFLQGDAQALGGVAPADGRNNVADVVKAVADNIERRGRTACGRGIAHGIQLGELLVNGRDIGDEQLPEGCQRHPPGAAVENLPPEFLLHAHDGV